MTSLVPTGIDWPSWAEVWSVLTLQAGFNTTVVMIGVTLLGMSAGIVGTFAVLRKRALMGDALSHATLPGIACASWPPSPSAPKAAPCPFCCWGPLFPGCSASSPSRPSCDIPAFPRMPP